MIKKHIMMHLEQQLQQKIDLKTKPLGSLGRLEEVALQIGKIQNTLSPILVRPTMLVFAADHGLADEGVSPFPKVVTQQMVLNFVHGGAAINVFCKLNGITLRVVDAGVDADFDTGMGVIDAKIARGTNNMRQQPAMSVTQCKMAIEKGAAIVSNEHKQGSNVIGFGEMGIANTSAAALLMSKYTSLPIDDCTGKGTGLNDAGVARKIEILKEVAHKYNVTEPIEVLATFGGFEIAMMTGAILKAAELGMVLLIDGFIATSALLAAYKMNSAIINNCIFTHQSDEKGHKAMLNYLNAKPLMQINMRLGEGSGAAVAYPLVKAAVAFLNEMASFDDAKVSNV
jgi:nicotinate-nucleotide--dimethylbenzimidazole phosphoribosyltransferase